MKIFVINSWSSSLKFELFDIENNKVLITWVVEKIWLEGSFVKYETNQKNKVTKDIFNHNDALNSVLDIILEVEKIIENKDEIKAIWHRVVHGWVYFSKPVIIDLEVMNKIEECISLAPLHNPANLNWIKACESIFPWTKQVACFDTWFHQTIEKEKYLYAIDFNYYEKYNIRKYGFHGISHEYISQRAKEILWEEKTNKIITCHIGNWASLSAIENWKVVNTSMWFTPLDGLIMWTRCWNIDPSVLLYLMKKENLSVEQVEELLNKKSWVFWISRKSSDMRDIEDWYLNKEENYVLAMNMYVTRIVEYIWKNLADLNWLDTIVMTAGVLENSPLIRKLVIEKLWFLWIELDEEKNDFRWQERIISTPESKTTVIVIPTNEEKMIAEETYKLVK